MIQAVELWLNFEVFLSCMGRWKLEMRGKMGMITGSFKSIPYTRDQAMCGFWGTGSIRLKSWRSCPSVPGKIKTNLIWIPSIDLIWLIGIALKAWSLQWEIQRWWQPTMLVSSMLSVLNVSIDWYVFNQIITIEPLLDHLNMHVFNDKARATTRDITHRSWFTRTKLTFSGAEPKIMVSVLFLGQFNLAKALERAWIGIANVTSHTAPSWIASASAPVAKHGSMRAAWSELASPSCWRERPLPHVWAVFLSCVAGVALRSQQPGWQQEREGWSMWSGKQRSRRGASRSSGTRGVSSSALNSFSSWRRPSLPGSCVRSVSSTSSVFIMKYFDSMCLFQRVQPFTYVRENENILKTVVPKPNNDDLTQLTVHPPLHEAW